MYAQIGLDGGRRPTLPIAEQRAGGNQDHAAQARVPVSSMRLRTPTNTPRGSIIEDAGARWLITRKRRATCMTEPAYRVSFERDEGQGYEIGARVSVHQMDHRFRTVRLDPDSGNYFVTRCERIRDTTWQALRL